MKLLLLATFVATACAMDYVGPSWPRLPLDLLLKGERPVYGSNNDEKIVGGNEVNPPNSVPSQISLQRGAGNVWSQWCGGSVLGPSTILNAAHCVTGVNPSLFRVVAGEHSLSTVSGKEQIRSVSKVTAHERYGSSGFENDISLIFLDSPLNMKVPEVAAITLPSANSEVSQGSKLYVTGWGSIYSGGSGSDVLMGVEVPYVNDTSCRKSYPDQIAESMICAGAGGVDSCQGDSGGPLYLSKGDKVQVGIVSWGKGCAMAGFPGVYTQVSKFITWIQDNNKP